VNSNQQIATVGDVVGDTVVALNWNDASEDETANPFLRTHILVQEK
jgi:hypothetical protein